jgi:hypothetical protein
MNPRTAGIIAAVIILILIIIVIVAVVLTRKDPTKSEAPPPSPIYIDKLSPGETYDLTTIAYYAGGQNFTDFTPTPYRVSPQGIPPTLLYINYLDGPSTIEFTKLKDYIYANPDKTIFAADGAYWEGSEKPKLVYFTDLDKNLMNNRVQNVTGVIILLA